MSFIFIFYDCMNNYIGCKFAISNFFLYFFFRCRYFGKRVSFKPSELFDGLAVVMEFINMHRVLLVFSVLVVIFEICDSQIGAQSLYSKR